jgi:aminopeptidase N
VTVDPGNIPPITTFGPDYQMSNTTKMRNVGADVANSMQWFQNVFGDNIGGDRFYVTSIASSHGQAFEGFLHMGEFTWAADSPGASELFRAHEVAHEWFGHKVGWSSYRDQWLSEAFAEYAAMLFVQNFVKGGDKFFEEILRSYDSIIKGNFGGGFSKFNRPWLIELNPAQRARVGPIGHGQRASTDEIPTGYIIQTYIKGPMVMHMLRTILRLRTNGDEVFIGVMKDYVHEMKGKAASTADFQRILERNTKTDWGWFFDAWVYGADIPSYQWNYDVKPDPAGGWLLTLDIDRRDASDDFETAIPVRIELEDGKGGLLYVVNDRPKQTVTQKLPSKPKNVVFGPDYSLLAFVRRK